MEIEKFVTVITAILGIVIILLGLSGDDFGKKSKLQFVIGSYILILSSIYLRFNTIMSTFLFILVFLFGGLGFMSQDSIDLERELPIIKLLWYSCLSWFFSTYQFMQLFFVLSTTISDYYFQFPSYFYLISGVIIMFIQYIFVTKDFFETEVFKKTIQKEWKPIMVRKNKGDIEELERKLDKEFKERLSVLLFIEDKNFFKRRGCFINLTEFIGKIFTYSKNKEKGKKKLIRGYSTIEQQFIRQYAMKEGSYRYYFRRKFFLERVYTSCLLLSIRKRKARIFTRRYLKRKKVEKDMILTLKLSILISYYENVLNNPLTIDKLLEKLEKQSGISNEEIDRKYKQFKRTKFKKCVCKKIDEIIESDYLF